MYGISQWLLYHHIKNDPTFPYVNVGVKKRLLINPEKLEAWLTNRTMAQTYEGHNLPTLKELLGVSA